MRVALRHGVARRRAFTLEAMLACALLATGASACEGVLPEPDFERMIVQRGYRPFEAADMFADGRAMRPPPEGTVSRDRVIDQPALTDGVDNGRYVAQVPVNLDRALLDRGRDRFETFCAACHGIRGDGLSPVAHNMELRKPPTLVTAPVTTFPAGRVFQVITLGYGLMPSYQAQLPVHDRWAVVAYLQALQLSQSVWLDALPERARARARRELP